MPLPVSTTSPPVAAVILAAGKSTRMRSKLPKPLHPICGLPMTGHVIRACRLAGVERIVVVIGHEAEAVRAGLGEGIEYALQETPKGTGDAVRSAQSLLADWPGTIVVLAGDVPLLPAETLQHLIAHHHTTEAATTLITAFLDDPTGYGRIVRDEAGKVARIVEHRDATEAERAIKEWSTSLYAFQSSALWNSLAKVRPANIQGEFYLTDTISILKAQGSIVESVPANRSQDVFGVNNRVELAAVATELRARLLKDLMLSGVTVTDPATTYVDTDVAVGQDTVIEPNTFLLNGTRIGEDCVIGPWTRIERSTLGNGVKVLAAQVVDSVLEDEVKVGPFANLRAGTHLGSRVKIGDFVETKNAIFGEKAQASHLAYIGDAEVGAGTNIGAGAITCNYNGYTKSRTVIGKNAFIGSNTTLIAPIEIGEGAIVAAGSSVTQDVPENALVIARCPQTVKEDWATQFRKKQKAKLANKEEPK